MHAQGREEEEGCIVLGANEYNFAAAFAVASLLALLTLTLKTIVEWHAARGRQSGDPE